MKVSSRRLDVYRQHAVQSPAIRRLHLDAPHSSSAVVLRERRFFKLDLFGLRCATVNWNRPRRPPSPLGLRFGLGARDLGFCSLSTVFSLLSSAWRNCPGVTSR